MDKLKIIKRRLSTAEVEYFINEIKTTPNITGYTKKEWNNFNNIWVAEVNHEIVGIVVNTNLLKSWVETSIVYVISSKRNQGIGKALFLSAFNSALRENKNIYYVSRNPIVIRWMKEKNMIFSKILGLPLPILIHIIIKSLSIYRIKEYCRKRYIYKPKKQFLHAYIINDLKK